MDNEPTTRRPEDTWFAAIELDLPDRHTRREQPRIDWIYNPSDATGRIYAADE